MERAEDEEGRREHGPNTNSHRIHGKQGNDTRFGRRADPAGMLGVRMVFKLLRLPVSMHKQHRGQKP